MTTLLGGPGRVRGSADQDLDREHHQIGAPDHAHLIRAEVRAWSRNREPPPIAADRTVACKGGLSRSNEAPGRGPGLQNLYEGRHDQ